MADDIQIVANSPEAMREEINRTRARMSQTIDEIEDVLVREKEKVREQVDVGAKVRRDPVRSLAMAAGAGLVLGFLTGGKKKSRTPDRVWEERTRRILDITREQEDEIEDLQGALRDVEKEAEAVLAGVEPEAEESLRERVSEYIEELEDRLSEYADEMEDRFSSYAGKVQKKVRRRLR